MKGDKKIFFINICFVAILVVLSMFAVKMVYNSSIKRTEDMGQQMAENFRLKDDTVFTEYRATLEMAAYKIKHMENSGKSIDEIYEWMKDYTETIIYSPTTCSDGIYAYIDGVFLHGNQYTYDDDYEPREREWYKIALLSKGGVCYSNVYEDIKLKKDVVSLSIRINDTDVVGIDIILDDIDSKIKNDTFAKGNLHVTFDMNGNVISHKCWIDEDNIHNDKYFEDLYNTVINNKNEKTFNYTDIYGNKNIVYSSFGETGWYSVACVSYDNIINSESPFIKNMIIFVVVYIILISFYVYRSYRSEKEAMRSQDIIDFIANTYYAIYIVDIKNRTCEIIKDFPEIISKMGNSKSYDKFLSVIAEYVEYEAKEEFYNCFSIDNLRQLAFNKFEEFGGDYRQKFEDDVYKWVNVQAFFDVEGFSEEQVILIFKLIDSEKTKELEQKKLLEESLASAQASSVAKNNFLSSMSHDMRTPLNAIIGLSELATIHSEKNSEVCEYLKKINLSSKHLLGLINDILDMAKIEQGKLELKEENLDIIDFVTDIVSVFRKQSEKKTINLNFDIKNRSLLGDTLRLSQILNNVISNAFKFSPDDGYINIDVIQSNTDYGEYGIYQFIVKDNGIGMSEDFIKKLFVPFEREERFGSTHIGGTGLGMPIVKNIVQVMNGEINVKSEMNKGSEFTIIIPILYGDKNSDIEEYTVEENKKIDIKNLEGIKILLVEDNEINMEITTEILEMYGVKITKAWNGQEAVDIFYNSVENYFDIILMDMQMPVLDGCGATEKIRAMSRNDAKTIPIIAVTANAFSDDIAKSMHSGMNAHIAKPIDFNNFMNIISKYL